MTPPPPEIDPRAFNSFEAEGWEQRAGGYHDFFAAITGRAIDPLLDAAAVGEGSRVLDVATGPGYVAAAAQGRGADATGVDIAAEMVALASRLHPEVRFLRGDAEQLPFEAASFDAAVASFAILHVGRPERAASELARVLAPGGKAALTVWDVPARARLMGVFIDAVSRAGVAPPSEVPAGPDFFHFSEEGEFARLLAGTGLGEVEVRTVEFRQRFRSADELWDGMLGGTVRISALIDGQSDEARGRIRGAFDELVSEYRSDGELRIPVSIKLASGQLPRH
jgi:ubiquinone/menaquinone biosynthesis C-methylase UbiE